MLYLIDKNVWLLLLVFAFAALGGWAWQGLRSRPKELAAQRERERLLREVLNSAATGLPMVGASEEQEREMDTLRRRADLDSARIAEMERALESARDRAEEAAGRAAEAERALERVTSNDDELTSLRAAAALAEEERNRTLDVEATPAAPEEDATLQSWRLRYFEQRVRYLESRAPAPEPELEPAPQPVAAEIPADDREVLRLGWRARYAEARARHLEQALRDAAASETPGVQPVAALESAPPQQDTLARWRMLYLEKRVGYLQDYLSAAADAEPPAPEPAPQIDTSEIEAEADRWKWRSRYLEARIRELEARPIAPTPALQPLAAIVEEPAAIVDEPVAAMIEEEEEELEPAPAPLVPAGAEERPRGLPAARNGAPDDFTLIDGVTPMLQSTLNALGIYHFEQIAAWTPANVAWLEQYLRLRGRIAREEWIEQADDLAREGPLAARRVLEDEFA